MRTIKDHARNVKCLMEYVPANASGVVFSFAEWMKLACDMKLSTGERNNHPITKAYLIALNSMVHIDDMEYSDTLTRIENIIESKEIEGL